MEKPENRPLFAVPIMAERPGLALIKAKEAKQKDADLVEYRIDRMKHVNLKTIINTEIPCIITNRHPEEDKDSPNYYCENARLSSLKEAAKLGANYIDIESKFLKDDFLKYIDREKTKVIISYHNFNETPPAENLHYIYEKIVNQGADIAKIVTMAKEWDDCIGIIELVRDAKVPIIGINMGVYGKVTRYNKKNYISYCALNKDECSASGQITLDYMISHFKDLEERHNSKGERIKWKTTGTASSAK